MAFGIEKINWEKIKSFTGNAIVGASFIYNRKGKTNQKSTKSNKV